MPYILLVSRSPMTTPSAAKDKDIGFVLFPTRNDVLKFNDDIEKLAAAHQKSDRVVACLNGTLVAVNKLPTQAAAAAATASNFCAQGATAAANLPAHAAAAAVAASDFCGQGATAAANLPAQAAAAASDLCSRGATAVAYLPAQAVDSADFTWACIAAISVAACKNAQSLTCKLADSARTSVEAYGRKLTNDALHVVADALSRWGAELKPAEAEEAEAEEAVPPA